MSPRGNVIGVSFQMKTKCETCLSAESIAHQQPQIFVVAAAPQETATQTVKYEQDPATTQVVASQTSQANLGTQNSIPIGVKSVTGKTRPETLSDSSARLLTRVFFTR